VVNIPSASQYTICGARPTGRMAPRSLRDTDSTRESGLRTRSQSTSVVPRNRSGDAPAPRPPMRGEPGSLAPSELRMMPCEAGLRPASTVAWPTAVSVIAWSWYASVNCAPARSIRARPPVNCPWNRSK
jgi:hypothetical protein